MLLYLNGPQPHKYVIQATVMKDSWPLSESSWKFVQMLKEIEKNELKGNTFVFQIFFLLAYHLTICAYAKNTHYLGILYFEKISGQIPNT